MNEPADPIGETSHSQRTRDGPREVFPVTGNGIHQIMDVVPLDKVGWSPPPYMDETVNKSQVFWDCPHL